MNRKYQSEITFIDDGNENETFFKVDMIYSYKLWKRTFQAFLRRYNRESVVLDEKEVIEKLADLEHQQWAHWTAYMLENQIGKNINRWRKQIKTDYKNLSEKEKESDRIWARKGYDICKKQFEGKCQKCEEFNSKFYEKAGMLKIKQLERAIDKLKLEKSMFTTLTEEEYEMLKSHEGDKNGRKDKR